jgi:hypothetical protein
MYTCAFFLFSKEAAILVNNNEKKGVVVALYRRGKF